MSLQNLTDRISEVIGTDSGLDATLKFKTDEGNVFVDSKVIPNQISQDDREADCTFDVSVKNALKLIEGEMNPMMALMTGKLKIEGDMGIAMSIAQKFGSK